MESKWITCEGSEAPRIFKKFSCGNSENIKLKICGLGFFEAYINGRKISEDRLVPAWSDYEPRVNRRLLYPINDTFTHRVYFLEYDISSFVCCGENTLEVILGNGWYNQKTRDVEGDLYYGAPRLWFEIMQGDDYVAVSDGTEKWKPSVIAANNIFSGEIHDFRLKTSEKLFDVSVCDAPKGELCRQNCPPDRVVRVIEPKIIKRTSDYVIFDAGENVSGFAVFEQTAAFGEKTVVRYGEGLKEDGDLHVNSARWFPEQIDEFISDGETNLCEIKFSWHGFRYFEIEGNAENVRVYVIHADVKPKCDFECDNELLNKLFDAYKRTQLTNMHCGVPSDCPHRERLGYTGDGQVTADSAMLIFSANDFYKKWIRDILDCQDVKNGHVQHTAPFYGGGGGPGGWGSAVVVVPYYHFKHYRDVSVLREAYPHMLKWVKYMQNHSENGVVVREEEGGWCLGDWCTPEKVALPEGFVNTYYLAKSLMYMIEIAGILGEPSDKLQTALEECRGALVENFYDEKENAFCNSVQGADAFMLDLGLGNDEMLHRLAEKYDNNPCFDTGIFGTDILINVLVKNGFKSVAFKLLTAVGENTYGYLLDGETTFWEQWSGIDSHNHPMFGAPVKHLFYTLLGIDFDGGTLEANPYLPENTNYAKGFLETPYGRIEVSVERGSDGCCKASVVKKD